jgi:hypothetical protein
MKATKPKNITILISFPIIITIVEILWYQQILEDVLVGCYLYRSLRKRITSSRCLPFLNGVKTVSTAGNMGTSGSKPFRNNGQAERTKPSLNDSDPQLTFSLKQKIPSRSGWGYDPTDICCC